VYRVCFLQHSRRQAQLAVSPSVQRIPVITETNHYILHCELHYICSHCEHCYEHRRSPATASTPRRAWRPPPPTAPRRPPPSPWLWPPSAARCSSSSSAAAAVAGAGAQQEAEEFLLGQAAGHAARGECVGGAGAGRVAGLGASGGAVCTGVC
jgi:hypothetical protein